MLAFFILVGKVYWIDSFRKKRDEKELEQPERVGKIVKRETKNVKKKTRHIHIHSAKSPAKSFFSPDMGWEGANVSNFLLTCLAERRERAAKKGDEHARKKSLEKSSTLTIETNPMDVT